MVFWGEALCRICSALGKGINQGMKRSGIVGVHEKWGENGHAKTLWHGCPWGPERRLRCRKAECQEEASEVAGAE